MAAISPRIQQRDVTRDSVMTCLKLSAVMLVEYVLKEYFGGLAMEWRTFIEHIVALPVTMRTSRTRRVFQIHLNARQPQQKASLQAAVAEVNRRDIRQGKRRLVFEIVGDGGGP